MSASPPVMVGLALAGGRSSRFGGDKAAAHLDGRPLLSWAIAHLDLSCFKVAVSAGPGSAAEAIALAQNRAVLADRTADADGPLAGIRSGLDWARAQGADLLAIEPCDAPLLPADLHTRLLAGLGSAPAAMAVTPDGPQPLCSIWRTHLLDVVDRALEGGAHPPLWRLLGDIGAATVMFDDVTAFINANTPGALRDAGSRPH